MSDYGRRPPGGPAADGRVGPSRTVAGSLTRCLSITVTVREPPALCSESPADCRGRAVSYPGHARAHPDTAAADAVTLPPNLARVRGPVSPAGSPRLAAANIPAAAARGSGPSRPALPTEVVGRKPPSSINSFRRRGSALLRARAHVRTCARTRKYSLADSDATSLLSEPPYAANTTPLPAHTATLAAIRPPCAWAVIHGQRR